MKKPVDHLWLRSKSPEWFLEVRRSTVTLHNADTNCVTCVQNQVTKEYYKEYLATTEAMFTKPREFQFLERVGPEYFMVKDKPFA